MTKKPKMADAMMRWLVFFSEGDCQVEMAELRGTLRDQNWALGARSGPHSGSEQGNVGRKMSAAAREVGAARSRSLKRDKRCWRSGARQQKLHFSWLFGPCYKPCGLGLTRLHRIRHPMQRSTGPIRGARVRRARSMSSIWTDQT